VGKWQVEKLNNLCPACFHISADDEDKSIAFSMDGNVQHSRLKDRSGHEYKVLIPKLFVDYGRRGWERMGNRRLRDHLSESCGHKFKATNGWNKAAAAATSKKGLDETGLMAVTCFHGIGVRFVNLYGGNERHTHGERLLEVMHTDCPEATKMRVCYDVACEFESAIKSLDNDWSKQTSVRIGRFHLYGHQLRCHILFNLLRTQGFGLMVGEEVEQLWSMLRHLIPSGRSSSGPRRTQKIDSCGLFLAQRQRESFGENLSKRWQTMLAMEEDCLRALRDVLGKTVLRRVDKSGQVHPEREVTIDYLDEQSADQVRFYESYRM
jgi:hypothetical protein